MLFLPQKNWSIVIGDRGFSCAAFSYPNLLSYPKNIFMKESFFGLQIKTIEIFPVFGYAISKE